MKQSKFLSCLPLAVAFLCLSLPQEKTESLTNQLLSRLAPLWHCFHAKAESLQEMQLANHPQISELNDWLLQQKKEELQAQAEGRRLLEKPSSVTKNRPYLIGKVIFRSIHTWNSTLWINLGELHNQNQDFPIIAKNSPVLSGDSVVGIIDYVGPTSSLVRLITDSSLTPSVRVARNHPGVLTYHIQALIDAVLANRLNLNTEQRTALLWLLQELTQSLPSSKESYFLAKGELQGHSEPLWRTPGPFLRGVGFNYDFKDDYGPSRDLRTGTPFDPDQEYTHRPTMSLIQTQDLLVTSGMDGFFPEGLKIALVHSIATLREGDYTYEITALPTAGDLMELQYLFVLPPVCTENH
jgi:rod shape-determining protein MreC